MEALKKYTGVIPDIPDPRDYFVTTAPAKEYPLPIVMPLSRIKDQGRTLRCNTKCDLHGLEVAFGQEFSDNFTYGECCSPAGGSSPRKSAEFLCKVGMVPAKVDPVNTLEPPEINSYVDERRDKLTAAAEPFRFERYAFLHTVDEIKAVMVQAKKYPGLYIKYTMPYDGSQPDQFGFWDIKNIKNPTGYHEVTVAAAEMHMCRNGIMETVKTANSWGEEWGQNGLALGGGGWNGKGYFWTDWAGVLALDAVMAVWPFEKEQDEVPVIDGVVVHHSIRLKEPYQQSEDVRWVQQRLNVHGYKVDTDGKYGPLSEKAVRAFQLAKGLTVDGVVSPITWAALAIDPAQVDPQPDNDPDIVAALIADFRVHLYGAVGDIYVWGGQGQTTITESIIKAMETSTANANRALAFWKKQKAAGLTGLRMWDCSGLIVRWLMDHNLSARDIDCDGLWTICTPVSLENPEKLVPFKTLLFRDKDGDKHHVGVYIGNGRVIEAQGRDAGVVCRGIYAGGKAYWTHAGQLNCLK